MKNQSEISGVIVGTVVGTNERGEVQVKFPWMEGKNEIYDASIATVMAGKDRGTWFMPKKDDEVLVSFDRNDANHPYIIGFLWNGVDKPPANDPNLRLIRSSNGHEIAIYDPPVSAGDTGYIQLSDANGNVITMSNASISIISKGTINIQAPSVTINGRLVALAPRPI